MLFMRIFYHSISKNKNEIGMPKCSSCLKNEVSFKELFKGKIMCSECEQRLSKVNTDSYEVTNNESAATPKQIKNPLGSCLVCLASLLIIFILFHQINFSDNETPKKDSIQAETMEKPKPNGHYKLVPSRYGDDNIELIKDETTKNKEPQEQAEITLSQIPNVVSYDIYAPFVRMGFNDLGKDFSVGSCFWTYDLVTERGTFYLRIFGKNPNEIQQIDASLTLIEDDTNGVKAYFIAVAKTVYNGSDFNEASRFINKNINRGAETKISGVRLRLIKNGRFNSLTIGVNDDF